MQNTTRHSNQQKLFRQLMAISGMSELVSFTIRPRCDNLRAIDLTEAYALRRTRRKIIVFRKKYELNRPLTMTKALHICRAEGIDVHFVDKELIRGSLGVYQPKVLDSRAEIAIDKNLSKPMQRITIAHEIGHHVLHRDQIIKEAYQALNLNKKPLRTDAMIREIEADMCASIFLSGCDVPNYWNGLVNNGGKNS